MAVLFRWMAVGHSRERSEHGGIAPQRTAFGISGHGACVASRTCLAEPWPGEVGKVVITLLHNLVMPLLCYSIGDFAELGNCSCGRTLPVLSRIRGRTRSMVRLPNGDEFYASFQNFLTGFDMIRQFQVVRRASEALELKLVATRRLNSAEADHLTKILQQRFRHPFAVSFSYHDEIPRSAGKKFEDYKDESGP